MIPLSRKTTSRKLVSTLWACSRQNLPRPQRLYATASKVTKAPAMATATLPKPDGYGQILRPHPQARGTEGSTQIELQDFLRSQMPYTILPTPLPDDVTTTYDNMYYPDSETQDMLAVIDACLFNCYDVPRAQSVFERLRSKRLGEAGLEARIYNTFLDAYYQMALNKDVEKAEIWVDEAWSLYQAMEKGVEGVVPNASTYAHIMRFWSSFHDNKDMSNSDFVTNFNAGYVLSSILERQISLKDIISVPSLDSEEVIQIITHLSRAAAEIGKTRVLAELGETEHISSDPLADVPEVMPVTKEKVIAKEGGVEGDVGNREVVSVVPFNLDNLRKHLAEASYARRVLTDDKSARQKVLEESVYDVAMDRWKHEVEKFEELGLGSSGLRHAHLQAWMYKWTEKLEKLLAEEIPKLEAAEQADNRTRRKNASSTNQPIAPFITLLKPKKLSLITVMELMRLQGTGGISEGMKTARALLAVGKAVEMEHKAEVLKKHNVPVHAVSTRTSSYFTKKAYKELRESRASKIRDLEGTGDWSADWTQAIRAKVGSFLVDALMEIAMVTRTGKTKAGNVVSEEQPAFFHSYEYIRGHKLGVIRMNPIVAERLSKDDVLPTLHPRHLPMLTPPKPWVSPDNGGYFYNKSSVMRFKDTQEQMVYLNNASRFDRLELVYAGLDVLGSTPWRINREIFDVVLEVWNSGERFGKIPPAIYDIPEPEKPERMDVDPSSKVAWMQRMRQWQQEKANCHSNRCSVNYRLEIARSFLEDPFYLPHNIDFRGRAYPIPPHLNHIGDDLSRGLLTFAEARPLGKSGLRWLKIHLSGLYGFDKGSFEERVQFTEDHLDDIFDSAKNPLGGRRWWVKAEDPWQCLATCIELHKALMSPDPESFASSLPVHQDGTCNGLQHYAALGGDIHGARQVNLDVADRPADVYTHVADMVKERIERDANNGDEGAKILMGKVTRRVVKQTVMTTVYGVTFVGARAQIERQLKDRGDIPTEKCWDLASYLAKHVLSCIGDLFNGATAIQSWLTNSARLIAKSIPGSRIDGNISLDTPAEALGEVEPDSKTKELPSARIGKEQMTSVVWTTPLGLPVVQPYRKLKRKQIMTSIQTVFISDPNSPSEVNSTKQASAFPPNFIHSLDATHMMLTAMECSHKSMTFASVHDSYWTHAATIDTMNGIIRDTFIALHEADVLGRLEQEFRTRYKDYKVPIVSLRTSKSLLKDLGLERLFRDTDKEEDNTGLVTYLTKRGRKKKNQAFSMETATEDEKRAMSTISKDGRFIDLCAVLPPLPKKGSFDVKTIRKSQYFFS